MKMEIPSIVENGKRKYNITSQLATEGDVAFFYPATYSNGLGESDALVLKIARDRRDNDLLANEASILNFLYPYKQKEEKLFAYLPRLIDSFIMRREGPFVNVFLRIDEHVSFEDIIAAYPKGIDFRDMVWMYKRLLVAIGFAHSKGIIHGAVLPSHVLIHPTGHGAKLLGWSYALNFASLADAAKKKADPKPAADPPKKGLGVWDLLRANLYSETPVVPPDPGSPPDPNRMYIKAMSVNYEKFYAPEILLKQTPTPATDIYMAAKSAVALLGGDVETNQVPDTVPVQIKAFLSSSLIQAQSKRPQDAWDLHEDFDKLLLNLVGKPEYRPFSMPHK
jgi:serine/threonine protein kinase